MNNKDLIKQYIDTGIQIPENQYKQLNQNDLKTYGRKRIIAHNMHANDKYSSYHLDITELIYLQPYLKGLPEINKKPFNLDKDSFWYYTDIFPELLDNIPDEYLSNFSEVSPYRAYRNLLLKPELIKNYKRINELNDYHIVDILETQPELYSKLSYMLKNIRYLDAESMVYNQPKLFKPMLKDGLIKTYTLDNILEKNPELYNELPSSYFENLQSWELKSILKNTPELVKNKKFINAVLHQDDYNKGEIIRIAPEIIKYLNGDYRLDDYDMFQIMEENPKYVKFFINKIRNLANILDKHPEYYKLLTPENKERVSTYTLIDMLKANPNVIKDIEDRVANFDFYDMSDVLEIRPKLLNRFLEINGHKLDYRELFRLKSRGK